MREGTPVEKGIVLTSDYLIKNEQNIERLAQYFTAYPDLFLDMITPSHSNIRLYPYQRFMLRAAMRYKNIFITAPRGFSKSFIIILALILQCIFVPGSKRFICANSIKQAVKVSKEKLEEIFEWWPLLKKEIVGWELKDLPGNYGPDYVTLNFKNKSRFDVIGPYDTTRGKRANSGLIDEARDCDEEAISSVVLPLVNVSRTLPDGTINPKEPNQQIIFMTSAGVKGSFAYEKMLNVFELGIIDPKNAICYGCDYRVPMKYGLTTKDYIKQLKMDPSFNEESFATELDIALSKFPKLLESA